MKKISIILLLIAASFGSFAQMAGELIQGTLVPGSTPNSVKVVLRSTATFTGAFSNVYFTIQIPTSVTPQPVVTIRNNALPANIPTYLPPVINTEGGMYNFIFSAFPVGATPYNFVANTPFDALELEVNGSSGTGTLRLAHLADGGASTLANFYIEVAGNDNTNYTNMFYGPGASNGGSFSATSFIPVANVVLPLNITDFKATRVSENGILSWTVENQTADNSHFEIERSLNGVAFSKVGQVSVTNNGSSTNIYSFTDLNITSLQHKGILYYRLKQIDRDGQFVYSQVRSIRLDKGKVSLGLFPNPAKSKSLLTFDLPEASRVSVTISDAAGKIVNKVDLNGNKGVNQYNVDVTKLASGTYLMRVSAGDDVQTLSLVVSK